MCGGKGPVVNSTLPCATKHKINFPTIESCKIELGVGLDLFCRCYLVGTPLSITKHSPVGAHEYPLPTLCAQLRPLQPFRPACRCCRGRFPTLAGACRCWGSVRGLPGAPAPSRKIYRVPASVRDSKRVSVAIRFAHFSARTIPSSHSASQIRPAFFLGPTRANARIAPFYGSWKIRF